MVPTILLMFQCADSLVLLNALTHTWDTLNHTPLVQKRKEIWETCKNEIEIAHNYYKNKSIPQKLRETYIEQCYNTIFNMSRHNKPYSSVVFAYVRHKKQDYKWLDGLYEVISK